MLLGNHCLTWFNVYTLRQVVHFIALLMLLLDMNDESFLLCILYVYRVFVHVKWVIHHSIVCPWVADGGDGLQIGG
jgi:hypothetical protein